MMEYFEQSNEGEWILNRVTRALATYQIALSFFCVENNGITRQER